MNNNHYNHDIYHSQAVIPSCTPAASRLILQERIRYHHYRHGHHHLHHRHLRHHHRHLCHHHHHRIHRHHCRHDNEKSCLRTYLRLASRTLLSTNIIRIRILTIIIIIITIRTYLRLASRTLQSTSLSAGCPGTGGFLIRFGFWIELQIQNLFVFSVFFFFLSHSRRIYVNTF